MPLGKLDGKHVLSVGTVKFQEDSKQWILNGIGPRNDFVNMIRKSTGNKCKSIKLNWCIYEKEVNTVPSEPKTIGSLYIVRAVKKISMYCDFHISLSYSLIQINFNSNTKTSSY